MSAPFTNLESLAKHLRAVVQTPVPIVLDSSVLDAATVTAISTAFALGSAPLTINGVAVGDIPDPSNNQLVISTGNGSALGKTALPITLTFSIANSALQVIVQVSMPKAWQFADSFPSLSIFPFDALTVADGAFFVFSSIEQLGYAWPGDSATKIDLLAGQNFLGEVGLGGFSVIATLLGSLFGNHNYKINGGFSPVTGETLPVGTLTAPIATGTFSVGSGSNLLSLSNPAVAVTIGTSDDTNPLQQVALQLQGVFQNTLQVAVAIPVSGSDYSITTTPLPNSSSVTSLIQALPGGSDFTSYIPAELNTIFEEVGLDYFTLVVDSTPSVTYLGLEISTLKPWPVITDVIELESLKLMIDVIEPSGLDLLQVRIDARCKFFPKIFTDEFDFTVALDKGNQGWEVNTVSGAYPGSVNLGDIVAGLLGSSDSVPPALHDISFSNFGVTAIRANPGDPFTYTAYGNATASFPLLNTQVSAGLNLVFTKTDTSYAVHLGGALAIGSQAFNLTLDVGTAGSKLTATWTDMGTPLGFGDIASALGWSDMPAVPPELDLDLTGASFSYDFTAGTLALTAASKNPTYGNVAFVARAGTYFFGIRLSEMINLSNLPLLKSVLSGNETVSVQNVQAVIVSSALDQAAAKAINALLTGIGMPQVPSDGLPAGVALSMTFQAGSYTQDLSLTTGRSSQQTSNNNARAMLAAPANNNGDAPPASTGAGSNSSVTSSTSPDGTVWYNLQKTFGPVTFQKVGVRYQDSILYLLMNASLAADGLTISVMGLGAGSPLTAFDLHFTINGIAITFQEGPVDISGALVGTLEPELNFYGELMLGFTDFQISALGGYAEADGKPSFFLYAVLDYPIGGPSFFFVTGLAAGFGYNRRLLIPDVSGVATFPLVQWATGSGNPPGMNPGGNIGQQVSQVLTTLQTTGVVAPSVGSYWLALGIKFTSFEIVTSFALLTVTFGTKFEIDLLGLSTLSIPSDDPSPVAQVQIELKVSFSPDTGLLAIAGQLTPQSYVLSQAAHLTGGFAFYLWFAGDHEGEVVLTLGGYNPNFTVPSYYPQVPRIGMNWKVTDDLSITGELYFALTSNTVMAGGKMSAVWQSGSIRAWFTIWTDFLMVFKPFHYYIDAGIDLGASFSIKLLFVRVTISIHIGVDLEIWGPDFSFRARVDLSIISFTISSEPSSKSTNTCIPWSEFVGTLLPSQSASQQSAKALKASALAASSTSTSTPAPVQINITQGMVKALDAINNQPTYLVSGETFQCSVTSVIPTKGDPTCTGHVKMAPDSQQPHDGQGNLIRPNEDFGAGPAGIQPSDFNPNFTLEVDTETDSVFLAVRMLNNSSKALWENKTFDPNTGIPQVDPSTGLTETTLPNTQKGFLLVPTVPAPDHTLPIPLPALEWNLDAVVNFWWSDPTYPTSDTFTSAQTVAATINTLTVSTVRSQLLTAIGGQGITIDSSVNVSSLSNPANNDLLAAPQLRLLGEQKGTS
jgi:hypothetical protein